MYLHSVATNYSDKDSKVERVDKWYIYNYSVKDLDNALLYENNLPRVFQTYPMDYALFVEQIHERLRNRNFHLLPNYAYTTQYYNFDLLNIPVDHPDRSINNTFVFKELVELPTIAPSLTAKSTLVEKEGKRYSPMALTSHTTANVWEAAVKRLTKKANYIIGKTFRREKEDKTHLVEFEVFELFIHNTNYEGMCNLIKQIYGSILKAPITLRRTRYDYVQPAIEMYTTGADNKEIELAGAGLFNTNLVQLIGCSDKVLGGGAGLARLYMHVYNKKQICEISEL